MDKQFKYMKRLVEGFIRSGHPVISMDTKKKELLGNFKNNGKEYRPKGKPRLVNDHDFGKKKAIPYGIYDIAADQGFVNIGQDHDTAEFAVASLKRWWEQVGKGTYASAKYLMITVDSGGSNGYRLNQFKWELQQFANETGLKIFICHFPPGTSKWNKIEHRLFSYISKNWAGEPLASYEVVLGFIGGTTTESGLNVRAVLDTGTYHLRKKPTKEEMQHVHLRRHSCHPRVELYDRASSGGYFCITPKETYPLTTLDLDNRHSPRKYVANVSVSFHECSDPVRCQITHTCRITTGHTFPSTHPYKAHAGNHGRVPCDVVY